MLDQAERMRKAHRKQLLELRFQVAAIRGVHRTMEMQSQVDILIVRIISRLFESRIIQCIVVMRVVDGILQEIARELLREFIDLLIDRECFHDHLPDIVRDQIMTHQIGKDLLADRFLHVQTHDHVPVHQFTPVFRIDPLLEILKHRIQILHKMTFFGIIKLLFRLFGSLTVRDLHRFFKCRTKLLEPLRIILRVHMHQSLHIGFLDHFLIFGLSFQAQYRPNIHPLFLHSLYYLRTVSSKLPCPVTPRSSIRSP